MFAALTYDDVLLVPQFSDVESRKDVDISTQFGPFKLNVGILSAPMDTITGSVMAIALSKIGCFGILHRFMSIDNNVNEFLEVTDAGQVCGVSIGLNEAKDRLNALYECGARVFCIDTAYGFRADVGNFVKDIRQKYGENIILIAGNVVTPAGVEYLDKCGADIIRLGIGGGSACTTRIKTGCGFPQLSAIMECRGATKKTIIADGGIKNPADFVKAIAAGADCIMVGGLFSGTDEIPGGWMNTPNVWLNKKKSVNFRGMASKEVNEEKYGNMPEWKTAEGVGISVKYKGSVKNIIQDLIGGLRSGMTYCGARDLNELKEKAQFIRITQAGYIEGTPHGENRL